MENISIDKIIDQWTSKKIKISPPSTIDAIKVTENILNFQFPDDFKEFYLKLDGFADWDWTENMFSIWPLARIVEEYNNESNKNFIVFADYLINSHQYGFKKDQTGIFKNYAEQPEFLTETFAETIYLISSDADILY